MNKEVKNTQTPEEKPKEEVGKSVITPKKRYFLPEAGKSVEADSFEEAIQTKTEKEEK